MSIRQDVRDVKLHEDGIGSTLRRRDARQHLASPRLAPSACPQAPVLTSDPSGFTVHATRISTPLKIDGRLDEAVYAQVPAITEYIQQEPSEGAPVSERT